MKKLAIFYGGKSAEHDISIITAIQVLNNLNQKKYEIIPIYINRDNSWQIVDNPTNIDSYIKGKIKGKLLVTGFYKKCLIVKKSFGLKQYKKIDVAINCCHGLNGEDGTLSGVLELNNIPYVGSGVLASSVGMDKVVMKDFFKANNIPCVKYFYFFKTNYDKDKNKILSNAEKKLSYPIVVKPANLGSSIGINISKNREELIQNIQTALCFDNKIILEQMVQNLREINCSCIGNQLKNEVSILEEPKNWTNFLDFDEKYILSGNKKTIDVKLELKIENCIKTLTKRVFELLGCSGVVRLDFLLDNAQKKVYVNEINTIPGSFANYLWKNKYSFSELLDKLIADAEEEFLCKTSHNYAYNSSVLTNYKSGAKISKAVK